MKKFALILAGLMLLALLVLVLVFFRAPAGGPWGPSGNATAGNPIAGNATLSAILPGNATTSGNATSANATSANATAANATAPGQAKTPQDLLAGTFLSVAVANATVRDLREKGLAPTLFTRPDAAGAVWWEVHLGRFPDLAPAEAEAARLAAGFGVWTRPRPVDPQAKPVVAAKGPSTAYLVSAGQYLSRHAADERARELAGLGFEPCVVRMPGDGGQMWYAVAVGQAKTSEEAEALSAGLAAKTGLPGRVSAEDAASLAGRRLCE